MLTFDPAFLVDQVFTVAVGGQEVEFTLGPEDLGDVISAFDWGMRQGFLTVPPPGQPPDADSPPPEPPPNVSNIGEMALGHYQVLRRVKSWNGIVDPQGRPVPCTETNKLGFFARYPSVLVELGNRLIDQARADSKNSGALPPG